jgi:hypothetical protein
MEPLPTHADPAATQAQMHYSSWTQPELHAIVEATAGFSARVNWKVVRAQYPVLSGRSNNALAAMYQRLKPEAAKKQKPTKWVQEEIDAFFPTVARHTRKGLKRDMTNWADVSEDPEFKQYGRDAKACESYYYRYHRNNSQLQKNPRAPLKSWTLLESNFLLDLTFECGTDFLAISQRPGMNRSEHACKQRYHLLMNFLAEKPTTLPKAQDLHRQLWVSVAIRQQKKTGLELLASTFGIKEVDEMLEPDSTILRNYLSFFENFQGSSDDDLLIIALAVGVVDSYYECYVLSGSSDRNYAAPMCRYRCLMYIVDEFIGHDNQEITDAAIHRLAKRLGVASPWQAGISPAPRGYLHGNARIVNRMNQSHRISWFPNDCGSCYLIGASFYENSLEKDSIVPLKEDGSPLANGDKLALIVSEKPEIFNTIREHFNSLKKLEKYFDAVMGIETVGTMTDAQGQATRQLGQRENTVIFTLSDDDGADIMAEKIFESSGCQPWHIPLDRNFGNPFVNTRYRSEFVSKTLHRMARESRPWLGASCPPGNLEGRLKTMIAVSVNVRLSTGPHLAPLTLLYPYRYTPLGVAALQILITCGICLWQQRVALWAKLRSDK